MQAWKAIVLAVLVSPGAAAQPVPAPRGPAKPPDVPTDFLQASNETRAAVKVEFFPGSTPPRDGVRPQLSFCVRPTETAHWPIDGKAPSGMLRMQVLRSAECGGPGSDQVVCRRDVQRTPRLQHFALRADGNGCAMMPVTAPAGMLRADQPCGSSGAWSPLVIHNNTRHGLWVTFRKGGTFGDTIVASGCWMPAEKRMACVDRDFLRLGTETVNNSSSATAGSCSERVIHSNATATYVDMPQRTTRYYLSFACSYNRDGVLTGCYFDQKQEQLRPD